MDDEEYNCFIKRATNDYWCTVCGVGQIRYGNLAHHRDKGRRHKKELAKIRAGERDYIRTVDYSGIPEPRQGAPTLLSLQTAYGGAIGLAAAQGTEVPGVSACTTTGGIDVDRGLPDHPDDDGGEQWPESSLPIDDYDIDTAAALLADVLEDEVENASAIDSEGTLPDAYSVMDDVDSVYLGSDGWSEGSDTDPLVRLPSLL